MTKTDHLRFKLIGPEPRAWVLRTFSTAGLLALAIFGESLWLPFRIFVGYWGVVFAVSLATWWNTEVVIGAQRVSGRGITSFRVSLDEIESVRDHAYRPRSAFTQIPVVGSLQRWFLDLAASYSRASGATVTIRTRKPHWRFIMFPLPFLVQRSDIELAVEDPESFTTALRARLTPSTQT